MVSVPSFSKNFSLPTWFSLATTAYRFMAQCRIEMQKGHKYSLNSIRADQSQMTTDCFKSVRQSTLNKSVTLAAVQDKSKLMFQLFHLEERTMST